MHIYVIAIASAINNQYAQDVLIVLQNCDVASEIKFKSLSPGDKQKIVPINIDTMLLAPTRNEQFD